MAEYMANWSVFVSANDPVSAARIAREMADDHLRSIWGITNLDTLEEVSVDLESGLIVECEELSDNDIDAVEGDNA